MASAASLSALSFPRLLLLFDRNTPSRISVPSSSRSTWALGTFTEPVRALYCARASTPRSKASEALVLNAVSGRVRLPFAPRRRAARLRSSLVVGGRCWSPSDGPQTAPLRGRGAARAVAPSCEPGDLQRAGSAIFDSQSVGRDLPWGTHGGDSPVPRRWCCCPRCLRYRTKTLPPPLPPLPPLPPPPKTLPSPPSCRGGNSSWLGRWHAWASGLRMRWWAAARLRRPGLPRLRAPRAVVSKNCGAWGVLLPLWLKGC